MAGVFYPADPRELASTVDSLLAAASAHRSSGSRAPGPGCPGSQPAAPVTAALGRGPADLQAAERAPIPGPPGRPDPGPGGAGQQPPKALVVPHAGYSYSGPVAASGYACLTGDPRRHVVLIGPSHFVPVRGMAGSGARAWRTPLGEVPVFTDASLPVDDAAHTVEHSLEVQLPFLQRALGERLAVLPVAVGRSDPERVADVLEPHWADPEALLVCSTDLSHYHDASTAAQLDQRTAQAIVARDADAVGSDDACGAAPLRGLLTLARRHEAAVSLLDLRTSADTVGDPRRVVGYGAFAVGPSGS